ncbi:hypothetical protein [Vulcanococcus limneticus]|uniref:hypothetical protein n=1 Tax=Vulcanococcus limneticus TaxID=2170428 RepID=UPI00398C02F4
MLLALLLLAGCATRPQHERPRVSDEGVRACQVEVEATAAPKGRAAALERCFLTIDQRLAQLQREQQQRLAPPAAPQGPAPPSPEERYAFCVFHQPEVQQAERARQRALAPWLRLAGAPDPTAPEVVAARQAYEQALAELNRLIPESMRGGLTLEPDAIRVFSRCERSDFG